MNGPLLVSANQNHLIILTLLFSHTLATQVATILLDHGE